MNSTKFINRTKELAFLEDCYTHKNAQLLVFYGRRRVGKTSLLLQFCKNKPYVYLLADLKPEKEQIRDFSLQIANQFQDAVLKQQPLETADALFAYLDQLWREKRVVVVFDEYPYLCKLNRAFSSILQKHWDSNLSKTHAFLILCGSSIGMMEKETLLEQSPIYGRRTGDWFLTPLRFRDFLCFFPNKRIQEVIELYGLVGGIPEYIIKLDENKTVNQNILSLLKKGSPLYREVEFTLREELMEPPHYFSILKAISFGKNTLNEIVLSTGLGKGLVSKYISVLEHLFLVRRIAPITENIEKTRKGAYMVSDVFFRFWFRFCFPYRSLLEEGKEELLLKREISPYFSEFMGPIFEQICREVLLPDFDEVGSWWYKENEIDIVARNTNELLFGECKWTNQALDVSALHKLPIIAEKTGLHAKKISYAFFSKSGFTKDALLYAKAHPDVLLFDLETIRKKIEEK